MYYTNTDSDSDFLIKWLQQLGIAATYLFFGIIIHIFFTSVSIVSAIWPGSGIALAAFLVIGSRAFIGVLLGSFLLNALIMDSPWFIGGVTLAQVSEAIVGYWLLTRGIQSGSFLRTLPDYLRLILLGGCAACAVGAILGVFALLMADIIPPEAYLENVVHWWMGDMLGVVLLTPFILAFVQERPHQKNLKHLFEVILPVTLAFFAGQIVFLGWFHDYISDVPRAYIMFIFVAWISIRLGIFGTTFVLFMIASQALWGAGREVGFFANEIVVANLKNYWLYMLVLSLVGTTIGIYVSTLKRAEKAFKISNQRYSDLVNSTDGIVWEADAATFNFTFVSEQAERLLGYTVEEWKEPGFWVNHLHPDDKNWAPEFCASRTSRMKPHDFEYRFIARNGRTVWLRDIVNVVAENGVPRWLRGIMIDVTDQKVAEQNLRIAATAFESKEGMIITDANNVILRVNSAFTAITGYTAKDIFGKTPKVLQSNVQDKNFYKDMWKSISRTGSWKGEVYNRRKNGEVYPQYLTITAVKDRSGEITNYVGTLSDISKTKKAEEEIKYLAFYDHLTGLPNRCLLLDRLKQALAYSARNKNNGALLFIDMDNFKDLNDTLGHYFGDQLLKQVAERLKSCVRESDTVSRLGGDEFVVILEKLEEDLTKSAVLTETVTDKILDVLSQPYQFGMHTFHSSSSIGVILFNNGQQEADELLKQADIAMYQAKKSGRNTVCFFDPEMQDIIIARSLLEAELRRALDNQQFNLQFQIQIDNLGCPLGAEALIRWEHPERGLISPAQFIPLAEETGLILPIGQWVLKTVCEQIKMWQQYELARDLFLSVNVSVKQFHQPNFVDQVQTAIQNAGINPKRLKLELTESMFLENVKEVIVTMNQLKDIGVQFSLDDFGTGYSSLQYLKELPLDQLKIDQSFVRDIVSDSNNLSIVKTIIAMAHSMNLSVIAEGVETNAQQRLLMDKGCFAYQGFLFGKPLPIEEFEALLWEFGDYSKDNNHLAKQVEAVSFVSER